MHGLVRSICKLNKYFKIWIIKSTVKKGERGELLLSYIINTYHVWLSCGVSVSQKEKVVVCLINHMPIQRITLKLLSLKSIISENELTIETFYHIRNFELFNIWTLYKWRTHNHNWNIRLAPRTTWMFSLQQQIFGSWFLQ